MIICVCYTSLALRLKIATFGHIPSVPFLSLVANWLQHCSFSVGQHLYYSCIRRRHALTRSHKTAGDERTAACVSNKHGLRYTTVMDIIQSLRRTHRHQHTRTHLKTKKQALVIIPPPAPLSAHLSQQELIHAALNLLCPISAHVLLSVVAHCTHTHSHTHRGSNDTQSLGWERTGHFSICQPWERPTCHFHSVLRVRQVVWWKWLLVSSLCFVYIQMCIVL